jgi:hypothetical protein
MRSGRRFQAACDAAQRIASACHAAAFGYALASLRAEDVNVALAARQAGAFARATADAITGCHPVTLRIRTGDRLRWEWLASSAAMLDGKPACRLLRECARLLSDALDDAADAPPSVRPYVHKLRMASAEAASLALSAPREGAVDLLLQTA